MFVKWSCGCVGIFMTEGPGLVLQFCDTAFPDSENSFALRNMTKQTYTKLTVGETYDLIYKIRRLIVDGEQLRQIRRMLK